MALQHCHVASLLLFILSVYGLGRLRGTVNCANHRVKVVGSRGIDVS
jgi:hypothetical protein